MDSKAKRGQQNENEDGHKKCATCVKNNAYDPSTHHSSTRSKICPYHSMTKNELMESLQGEDYEIYTRKTSLDSALCVATEYKDTVKDVISDMVATIKEVVIKANLFAAFYPLDKLE